MGTQKEIARQIVDDDGDYVLALKGNQGTLYSQVQRIFADALANGEVSYDTVEKGHGRLEIRRHWMIDDKDVIERLNPDNVWKGLRSLGMVEKDA